MKAMEFMIRVDGDLSNYNVCFGEFNMLPEKYYFWNNRQQFKNNRFVNLSFLY